MSKREVIVTGVITLVTSTVGLFVLVIITIGLFVGAWDDAALRSPRFVIAEEPPTQIVNTAPAIVTPATSTEQAVRLSPPTTIPETTTTTIPPIIDGAIGTWTEGRCTQYEPLLAKYAVNAGWDVNWISKIMWRESRCTTGVVSKTGCCVSLLQLYVSLHLRDHRLAPLYNACGVYSWNDLDGYEDIERHICAAAGLYSVVGKQAWAL